MKLNTKLKAAILAVLIPVAIAGMYNFYKIFVVSNDLSVLVDGYNTTITDISFVMKHTLFAGQAVEVTVKKGDMSSMREASSQIRQGAQFAERVSSAVGNRDLALDAEYSKYLSEIITQYNNANAKINALNSLQTPEEVAQELPSYFGIVQTMLTSVINAKERYNLVTSSSLRSTGKWLLHSQNEIWWGLGGSILCILLVGFLMSNRITAPIQSATEDIERIVDGDISERHDKATFGEFSNLQTAIKDFRHRLRDIVGALTDTSQSIDSSSAYMSGAAGGISESAALQASSAEEISSSMEEMAANIQQNAQNAKSTEQISTQAAQNIRDCHNAAVKTVNAMNVIAEKISIIDTIAFQTNILALNAAVEAARAGDAGHGFAVVAADIRKLAEKSANAAKDIDKISKGGIAAAAQTNEVFAKILPDMEHTAQVVQEISAVCDEQATGGDSINNAVMELSNVAQQFVAIAEETSAASQDIATQAGSVSQLIKSFSL